MTDKHHEGRVTDVFNAKFTRIKKETSFRRCVFIMFCRALD